LDLGIPYREIYTTSDVNIWIKGKFTRALIGRKKTIGGGDYRQQEGTAIAETIKTSGTA
jgi:hypothetical protein